MCAFIVRFCKKRYTNHGYIYSGKYSDCFLERNNDLFEIRELNGNVALSFNDSQIKKMIILDTYNEKSGRSSILTDTYTVYVRNFTRYKVELDNGDIFLVSVPDGYLKNYIDLLLL